jgi:hypothetical protein
VTAANAIMSALRAQRRRDLHRLLDVTFVGSMDAVYRMQAWCWWGWAIGSKDRDLGIGGHAWPYWSEPKRWRKT